RLLPRLYQERSLLIPYLSFRRAETNHVRPSQAADETAGAQLQRIRRGAGRISPHRRLSPRAPEAARDRERFPGDPARIAGGIGDQSRPVSARGKGRSRLCLLASVIGPRGEIL